MGVKGVGAVTLQKSIGVVRRNHREVILLLRKSKHIFRSQINDLSVGSLGLGVFSGGFGDASLAPELAGVVDMVAFGQTIANHSFYILYWK